jgi:hypothetical protein
LHNTKGPRNAAKPKERTHTQTHTQPYTQSKKCAQRQRNWAWLKICETLNFGDQHYLKTVYLYCSFLLISNNKVILLQPTLNLFTLSSWHETKLCWLAYFNFTLSLLVLMLDSSNYGVVTRAAQYSLIWLTVYVPCCFEQYICSWCQSGLLLYHYHQWCFLMWIDSYATLHVSLYFAHAAHCPPFVGPRTNYIYILLGGLNLLLRVRIIEYKKGNFAMWLCISSHLISPCQFKIFWLVSYSSDQLSRLVVSMAKLQTGVRPIDHQLKYEKLQTFSSTPWKNE